MAKGSAKRIEASNQIILKRLRLCILISSMVFLISRSLFKGISNGLLKFTDPEMLAFIGTNLISVFCYYQLNSLARPLVTADGRLVEGGSDLGTAGLHQYMLDYIYLGTFIYIMSFITTKAWFIYLSIPAYGFYRLFGYLKTKR